MLPLCALIDPSPDYGGIGPTLIVTAASVAVALVASLPDFRMNRAMENASLALPDPPKNDPPRLTPPAAPDATLA